MRRCHVAAQPFVGINPSHGFRLAIKRDFGGARGSTVVLRYLGGPGHFGGKHHHSMTLIPYDAAKGTVITVPDLDLLASRSLSQAWVAQTSRGWLAF